jgi:diguanylate cyclase (GGDEF)-like protein/PAS domain S-box-containing protein
VVDGEGRVVARSQGPDTLVGRRVKEWERISTLREERGLIETSTAEGGRGVFGFYRSERAPGWRVFVGETDVVFASRWRQPTMVVALAIGLATLLAIVGAVVVARRITSPLSALAAHAEGVSRNVSGAQPAIRPSRILEFEALRRSIERSEQALRNYAQQHRAAAEKLAESETRYRALVHAGALVVWRATLRGEIISADGWEALTGFSETEALGKAWREAVRPEDARQVDFTSVDPDAPDFVLDAEFRIRGRDGAWRWVRGRGAIVRGADGAPIEWVGVLEDVDERRNSQERIAYLAHHDALTGLPNRITFRERIAQALRRPAERKRMAALYLDLDRFKDVNDAFGHSAGDALLVQAATRLSRAVGAGEDMVSRLGGDEFGVICFADDPYAHAAALADRIVAELGAPFAIDTKSVAIGASVGVALPNEAGDDVETLLRNADMALYSAKDEGAGRWRVFQASLGKAAEERIVFEQEVRAAVRAGDFELHFQPLIALQTGALNGFEALLRWRSPTRGMVSPAEFVPVAEKAGLIVEIGEWVTREACRRAAGWPAHLGISVNVSPRQLSGGDFAAVVRGALAESGLAAERLTLELTESALVEAAEATMATLMRLKAMGCKIAMDDFGTGYSSLGYLRSFRFDKVKIDRSFISDSTEDEQSAAILKGILSLCRSLHIPNTAEGVETEEQRDFLRQLGCEEAQGYLFGRPVPRREADEIAARTAPHDRRLRLVAAK